ncbi:pre-rRNA-processing protein TSR2 homolog isoform X2 [Anabrus simplex]|uniref:pre-rRNA-processing protein TSR2 homolog isoform X2 n=1 Tax=Anabrus simplex TaxID=316456 RepID=UPI0035A35200
MLALDHGMGGQQGFVMARKLPELVMTMFTHGGSVSAENISDELFDFMDTHMKTECEDGSCEELGIIIWNLFQLCKNGNQTELEKEVHKLALARHLKRKGSSREFTYCEAMAQDGGPLKSIAEDSLEEVDISIGSTEEGAETLESTEDVLVEEENSDWTAVTRRRRR